MPSAADVLATLHLILQVGFISVTVLLLFVTVVNRMRVRHVVLSWRTGAVLGLPAWPTVFLAAVLLFCGGAMALGQPLPWSIVVGYFVGGGFWLAASLLSTSVLVTEFGLIYQPNRAGHAVAWGQVVDYFDDNAAVPARYVFFYMDPTDVRRRLELKVPRTQREAFREVVREKLDARFDLSAQQVYGKKALEG
jgi:hypothetical protein